MSDLDTPEVTVSPVDEMADGRGNARPHWRTLLGGLSSLGRETLAERTRVMQTAFAEEGVTAILPGEPAALWRCDPVPLPLTSPEFTKLAAGLAQRARLLEAILQDLYGAQDLLASGVLPADLVFANPAFLRPCRNVDGLRSHRMLHFYAADLIRGPDGQWRVLADRTGEVTGLAYVLENRRILSRVVPELFQSQRVRHLRPFLERCGDTLQALSPINGGSVALLSGGHADPLWFEHVVLSRELSTGLVEGGDLTIRGAGGVFLKTLRGLQRIGVLLRQQESQLVDPLELSTAAIGTPGLLDAVRNGAVRVVNDIGTALVEAPGLAAFLPTLSRRLLSEELLLPSQATLWLGEGANERIVRSDLEFWLIRSATEVADPILPSLLSQEQRAALSARIAASPARYAATEAPVPSVAPCVGPDGLEPKPVALRMFLAFDGQEWHTLPGGLARALSAEDALVGRLPRNAVSKDVWVMAEDGAPVQGALGLLTPTLAIRRTAGDFPSRVADNFYWLGRYLERLEESARLQRALMTRLLRPSLTGLDIHEVQLLAASLAASEMLQEEDAAGLGAGLRNVAVLHPFRENGAMRSLLNRVARQAEQLRDRLTGEMHALLTRSLRDLGEQMRNLPPDSDPRAVEHASLLTARILEFAAAMAGSAAENMVRGGGRLFMDFGRRVERAKAIAAELAQVLDRPNATTQPGRVEAALRLALEMRDSVITYRTRYLAVLQPAPALDLILADEGNPRGLAFQLLTARDLLREIAEEGDTLLLTLDPLLTEARRMVQDVLRSSDQTATAALLPGRLRALEGAIVAMAERVSRRYFTLLPVARSLGPESEPERWVGAT